MGLTRDGVNIHVSSFSGDGAVGGAVNLLVDDLVRPPLDRIIVGNRVEIVDG